jgi:hypothetical protein
MHIALLPIVVTGVATMIIGMIWHSKALFGNKYMQAIGADMNMSPEKMKECQKRMWQLYLTQYILAIVQIYVLAYYIMAQPMTSPVHTTLWLYFGFVLTTIAGGALWSARPRKDAWNMFFISAGFQLVVMIVSALILKAWM